MKKAILCTAMLGVFSSAQADGQLFLYNWSNYIPPDLLEQFEEETGIDITLDVYDSNETMLAKLQAGASGYDVIVPSDYMIKTLIEEELVEKIEGSSLENFKLVMAPHNSTSSDPNRDYSVPYMWGTTGFSYDSARLTGDIDSWGAFFEPSEELKGQIGVLNDEVETWNAAAYFLGIDKCSEDSEDAKKILEVLEKQKPYVAVYQSDGTIDRMASKEVIMHQQFNGASHRTKEKLDTIKYVYPKEGISSWVDNFMVVKDAPNLENAKIFLNWMMAPENVAKASNYTGYMNAIEGSAEFLDDALKSDPAVNMPEEFASRLRPSQNCSGENRALRNKVWTRLKN